VLGSGVASILIALAAPSPAARAHQLSPDELRQVGFQQRLGELLPLDLVFRDESGQVVPLSAYLPDRPVVLTLNYFHCPNLCSLLLDNLADRLRMLPPRLGEQYTVLTVSVDPRETPALAAEKRAQVLRGAAAPGSAADWHFLTGEAAAIERLSRAVGFEYLYDEQEDEYVHPAGVVVLTPGGRISRYLYGPDIPPTDLRLALVEAADGRVGSLVDRALLLCYAYDPATGRYTPIVMGAVRAAGAAMVLAMGVALGLLWRGDLRRQHEHSEAVS